eukprot:13704422-Alexandrium_andersonii.AAC.1
MHHASSLPHANSEGLRGLRIGGLRIGVRDFAISRATLAPSIIHFASGFGISTDCYAERTPRELRGPIVRPLLK